MCSFTVSFAYYAEEGKWRITTSCSVHTCGRNLDVGTIVPTRWVASHLAPLIRRDEGGVIKASTVKALLKESLKLTVPDRCAHLPAGRPACVCAHLPAGPRACSFGAACVCAHLRADPRACVLTCPPTRVRAHLVPAREVYRAIALARKLVSGEKTESFQKVAPLLNVSHVLDAGSRLRVLYIFNITFTLWYSLRLLPKQIRARGVPSKPKKMVGFVVRSLCQPLP